MSLIYNRTMDFNGTSQIENPDGEMPLGLMSMNANSNISGIYITKSISNVDLYTANKEAADADFAEFEQKVFESLNADTAE